MSDTPASEPTADFGFRRVPVSAKRGMVHAVFDRVAPRYDVMNDLMSLGVHRVWKRILVTALDPRRNRRLLDLAGGTGDVAFGWLRLGGGDVLLADINPTMLSIARDRALQHGVIARMDLLVSNAERLPLPDRVFDRVAIAFGLRNCTDKAAVLHEACRVLRPGGRFFCLEFSRLQVAVLASAYDAWSFRVLPLLGGIVAGTAESYRYLAESIRTFPDEETLARMLRDAGFARVSVRKLSGGIAAIHDGWRL